MADDVVEHLTSVDILEEHIPVVICPDHVAHTTDVRMIGQGDDGGFTRCADLLAMVCPFALCRCAVLSIVGASGDDLDSNLFSSLLVPCQLHLAHATSADRLSKLPVSCLSVDGGPPPQVLSV